MKQAEYPLSRTVSCFYIPKRIARHHIDGLVQKTRSSIANALELRIFAHIPGSGWWPGDGFWFLWTHGYCISTYCPLGLSLWHRPFWWDVHGLPQLFVETSVLSGLSSLSPGYGQFHRHTEQGIPDTGFHRRHHIFCNQVFGLWRGPGWSAGCWWACGKHRLMFFKFWPVFRMYLWYMVGPRWCGPRPCLTTAIWRCRKNSSQWQRSFQWRACFGVGGSWRPTPSSHCPWVRTWHDWPKHLSLPVWWPCSLLC